MKGLLRRSLICHLQALVLGVSLSVPTDAASQIRPYTGSEIAAAITLPTTPKLLLQNLKAAWDHDWLVQSSFYDDSNLLKFFNASKVAWEQESKPGKAAEFGNGRVTIDTHVFPNMTVELIRGTAPLSGHMLIRVDSISGITVGLVREVFGKESEDKLDFGIATDAHGYDPTTAGSLEYQNHDKELRTAAYEHYWILFGVQKTKPGLPTQGYTFLANERIDEIVMLQMER